MVKNCSSITAIFIAFPILLAGCTHSSDAPTSSSTTIHISAVSLDTETVTLTNSGNVNIESLATPVISSPLTTALREDVANSTCASATFPMQPGSQCTYSFSTYGTDTVPGVNSGTISIPITFATGSGTVDLSATVSNYLYAAGSSGVYEWNGSQWTSIGGPPDITALITEPGNYVTGAAGIYAGSNTGIGGQDVYKWNGASWTPVSSGSAPDNVYALAFTSLNSTVNQIFAGSGNNTAGSDNVNYFANNTWNGTGSALTDVHSMTESNLVNGTLYAGSMTGTIGADVNEYNGNSWSPLGSGGPTNVDALAFNSGNNSLYTGSVGNTSTSNSDVNYYNGSSWNAVGTGSPIEIKALALDDSGDLYAAGLQNNYNLIQQNSSAQNWNNVASSADGKYLSASVVGNDIFTSNDYGVTWVDQTNSTSQSWKDLASSADGSRLVAVVGNGNIYTSSDYGVNWTVQTNAGIQNWYGVASSADGSHLAVIVTGGGDVFTSSDYGATWTDQVNSHQPAWRGIASSADGSHLVATVQGGDIFTSNDYGATWIDQTNSGTHSWHGVASSADGSHLAAVVGNGDIYTSSDFGVTWVDRPLAGSQNWLEITSSSDGSHLAAASNGAGGMIVTSSDYGATWTEQVSVGNQPWNGIASSADGSRLIAAAFNHGYLYTGLATNVNEFNNTSWLSLPGNSGIYPDNVDALVIDSASSLYTGSLNSFSGNDVNQFALGVWTPLSGIAAPTNVTALTLGTELSVIAQ